MKIFKCFDTHILTVGNPTEVDSITRIALILQKIFGFNILDPDWTWKSGLLYRLFSIFVFIYVIFGTIETFRQTSDSEVIAEASYALIMIGIYPIKLLLFINNKLIFSELYIVTKTTLLDAIKKGSNSNKVLAKAKKIVVGMFAMISIPIANHELLALYNYLKGDPTPLSRTTDILIPLKFPYYEISWILHSIFLFEIGSTTAILDMWFIILIFFLCAASDNLADILKVEEQNVHENKEQYAKRLNESLKKFYNGHVQQIKFLNLMNKMYKWLAFVPLCNAAMCSCIILLLLSKDLNWKFAPHFLPMFVEIFAYNYFGEQIKNKTTNTKTAILNFDWTSLQLRDRKSYCIIITYMQKEFGITTAAGSDLSLITMTSVLQVIYRAFTMLRSVND